MLWYRQNNRTAFYPINGTDAADFTDGKWVKIALTPAVELSFFEERGTRTAADILFSVGKCGMVITVKGKKNLLRYEKKNWKINVFIWIKGVFGYPFSIF